MARTVSLETFQASIGFLIGGDNIGATTVTKTADAITAALQTHTDENGQLSVEKATTEIDFIIEKANQVKRALIQEIHAQ